MNSKSQAAKIIKLIENFEKETRLIQLSEKEERLLETFLLNEDLEGIKQMFLKVKKFPQQMLSLAQNIKNKAKPEVWGKVLLSVLMPLLLAGPLDAKELKKNYSSLPFVKVSLEQMEKGNLTKEQKLELVLYTYERIKNLKSQIQKGKERGISKTAEGILKEELSIFQFAQEELATNLQGGKDGEEEVTPRRTLHKSSRR